MIEMLQGFLACIGAALFFVTIVIAIKPIIWRLPMPSLEDDDSGAPEGDQFHFRIVEDPRPHLAEHGRAMKLRRR